MDVLANVLTVTNVAAHVYGSREFIAPWAVKMLSETHSAVHIVRRGSCWLHRDGHDPVRLHAGDVVLLGSGVAHALSSEFKPEAFETIQHVVARTSDGVVRPVGAAVREQESTIVQCAGYEFSREASHPLQSLLPPLIRIPASLASKDVDLQQLLAMLGRESTKADAGSDLIVRRFIDILFVYILRAWLREQPEGTCGWLGALRDPQIRKALSLIHESPQHPWTVESLARAVAMSRAAFAKRFAELVGEPPLAYVTRWRIDLAAKLLRESADPVAKIAGRVGYVSETAFAKAFRRRRKLAPGQYRYHKPEATSVF